MPELPDVEGFRRYLARHAEGQRIVAIHVPDRQIVRNRSPQALGRALRDKEFAAPTRHGKWLIAPLADRTAEVLLHFGMTGLLTWSDDGGDRHPHDRAIFVCERGELRYNNMRRFGGLWLARDMGERDRITGPLGPDAATITRDEFERLIVARRGGAKAALMDQRLLAGVGNLLSDEILWRSRIDPRVPVARVGPARRQRLYDALHAAVTESIRYGRVPHGQRWLTRVRDDRDPRCPRCATKLRRATVAGRTACWCPRCQR
jgi:formamidopyrimidine-DNA glycosylase